MRVYYVQAYILSEKLLSTWHVVNRAEKIKMIKLKGPNLRNYKAIPAQGLYIFRFKNHHSRLSRKMLATN